MANSVQSEKIVLTEASSKTNSSTSPSILYYLKDLINLDEDKADELKTIEDIKRGVVFRGSNLWVLIFAIFIASIGLNVNSPAVIIGAMLISPLMGPIMGIGLGIGINDLELIKKGVLNLAIAVFISIITSALYFSVTPIDEAQSELLARTTPTLWDVLIAIFGGLAGIVAHSRKEKSNAVPGVAIATALMPPLCTAGFGLATQNFSFFFGAFYLFFINSVFICLSTFVIVRYLDYPKKEFANSNRERRVKNIILLIVILTILPSTYTAYKVVQKSLFERSAIKFIQKELNFAQARVISKEIQYTGKENRIEVILLGRTVSDTLISIAQKKLADYKLLNTELVVHQDYNKSQESDLYEKLNENLKASIVEELYRKNAQVLETKDLQVSSLQSELIQLKVNQALVQDVFAEVKVQYPTVTEFTLSKAILSKTEPSRQDTVLLAYAKFKQDLKSSEITKLREWLKVRTKAKELKLAVD